MHKNPRHKQIPNPKRQRRRKHKPIPPRKLHKRKNPHPRHRHAREQERRHASQNGVWNGEEHTRDFADDAEEDEEEAAPASGASVGAARDGDHTVVLGEYGEGRYGEEGGEEASDAISLVEKKLMNSYRQGEDANARGFHLGA